MKKVASSSPVNKTAAMVTQPGTHFTPKLKPDTRHESEICPPIWAGTHLNNFTLKGVRFGRFTVVGLSAKVKKRWVCRCDCGNYEMRTARAIQNPKNTGDACRVCLKTIYICNKGKILQEIQKSREVK